MIKSPLRYPGGKSRKRPREFISGFFPATIEEYREPFIGGGGIFLTLQDRIQSAWINDLQAELVAFYQYVKNDPEEFIRLCQSLPLTEETFQKCCESNEWPDALRYFFVNRTVWAGRVIFNDPSRKSRQYFSHPDGWKSALKNINCIRELSAALQKTRITNFSYQSLLFEPSDKNVWIYLDPPYVKNTELSHTDKQYEHNFSWEDHDLFWENVALCPYHYVISYDDCEYIRAKAAKLNLKIFTSEWAYGGTSLSKKEIGKELVVTNADVLPNR